MSGYDDIRLPDTIEIGAQGGPGFKTTVLTSASGREKRNVDWSQEKGRWDIGYGARHYSDPDDAQWAIATIMAFYRARRAKAYTFRFRDWLDYTVERQKIGETDTFTATFQMVKTYEPDGPRPYHRDITKPVPGTLSVWVNNVEIAEGAGGSEYQVDDATGIITLGATLVATDDQDIEAACTFDCHVRFDIDNLAATALARLAEDLDPETTKDAIASIPAIPIVEVRG